ncbi:MAG TPA: PqqD family protein [Gemmatimonadaceae bacterium]|nr:PqqD family protein [Gemmatimonadaceae bacterium]
MIFPRRAPANSHEPADGATTKWIRCAHVVSTVQGDSTILLDARRGQYHTLNEIGGRVWALLADGTTIDALVSAIQAEYDAPPDRIALDVHAMLAQLQSAGLLVHAR